MKKFLIAGGLGAIGKNLITSLNNKFDCSILVIDNISSENKNFASFFDNHKNVTVEILDISNKSKETLQLAEGGGFAISLIKK